MIRAIVSGVLTRQAEERLSKTGKPYLKATIRDGSGDGARWVAAFVFNDAVREAISGMAAGEAIAVAGEIDAEIFTPEAGPARISWSIKVDGVLSAQTGARKRSAAEPEQPREGRDDPIDDVRSRSDVLLAYKQEDAMFVCKGCGRELDADQFYRHAEMANGHLSSCKDCVKARIRAYREANIESLRAYDRWRGDLPHRKTAVAARRKAPYAWPNKREWREQNPEKYRAHIAAQRIPRPEACQQCGASGKLHRHHPDYSKPKLVEFLCSSCHGRRHREERNLPRAAVIPGSRPRKKAAS